jgi:hypothetical protein
MLAREARRGRLSAFGETGQQGGVMTAGAAAAF